MLLGPAQKASVQGSVSPIGHAQIGAKIEKAVLDARKNIRDGLQVRRQLEGHASARIRLVHRFLGRDPRARFKSLARQPVAVVPSSELFV